MPPITDASPTGAVPTLRHYPDLVAHRADILAVLERHATPLFVCERDNLADRYRELERCLGGAWPQSRIAYSFKTNYHVARLPLFRSLGAAAEVVSGREYRLARETGYPGRDIIFNGPRKSPQELDTALAEGALVNVNDRDELDAIVAWAAAADEVVVEIGMRLSGPVPKGGISRFGFSMDNDEATEALHAIARSPHVSLTALHTHLYGDTDDPEFYRDAAGRLGAFAREHIPDYQKALKVIDVGGGFPAHTPKPRSRSEWRPQPIGVYVEALVQGLRPFFPETATGPTLVVEPGRYLTADGVVLISRVLHVKARDGVQQVNGDGTISMVPLTHYCPQVIQAFSGSWQPHGGTMVPSILYGATCRENDILYQGVFPVVHPGDYLVHYAAGAYNASLSPDFIFESPDMVCI